MKKQLLLLTFALCFCGYVTSQKQSQGLKQAPPLSSLSKPAVELDGFQPKTTLCRDTLRYGSNKQEVFGTGNPYYFFDIWRADNEAISQTYLLNGETIQLHGIEVIARNRPSDANYTNNVSTAVVNVAIYNVNASNVPTTLIGSTTINVNGYAGAYYYANFSSPLTISSNYAVVLTPTTNNAVVEFFINDIIPNQLYDEDFCRIKSTYANYNSGGLFVAPPTYTANYNGGPYNFDLVVSPIVSYTINTVTSNSPVQICLGESVSFSGIVTPANILSNRMFNYNKMITHFNPSASDSTYVWDVNDPNFSLLWSKDHNYTYTTAGTYNTRLYTLAGMGTSCVESVAGPTITVKSVPTVSATASSSTICNGSSTTLTASGADTYSWDNSAGTNGSASVSPSNTTTYTVTGTTNGCSNTAQTTVTVNPMSGNAAFNYSSSVFCASSAPETPTSVDPGTFSATPSGLSINTSTGEVDFSASTAGTYTVTKTIAGTCPDTKTQSITVTAIFDASFSYNSAVYCTGAPNPLPAFPAGSSGGVFSSTTGLVINGTTGEINLSTSTPGTYTVTNTIAATGGCSQASETFDIEVTAGITATVSGGGTACEGDAPIDVLITFTGSGPWDFTYSDGTNLTTITGQATSPYAIQATESKTYTVTSADNGTCTTSGSGSAIVVFNSKPVLNITPVTTLCVSADEIAVSASPAGGTFSGDGISGNQFDPATAGIGVHTITYSYTDANSCSNQADIQITVTAEPAASITPLSAVCADAAQINLSATPSGGIFSGNGVAGSSFTPATAGAGTHTITYTYTENGCTVTTTEDVTVKSVPTVALSALANVCVNKQPFSLSGGSPAGGSYSGTGITNNVFSPSAAGVGTHTITYSYENNEGCSAAATQNIVVEACLDTKDISDIQLSIYPNPAKGVIIIDVQGNNILNYSLMSADGKIILEHQDLKEGINAIDISSYSSGVYFIHYASSSSKGVERIIIK